MEIAGKIIAVLEPRGGVSKSTGNPWKTQDYVIETIEQYPHRMCFNVFGEDKISQFNLQLGDEVTVSFDVNAREYQGRWFNDIRAWKVERGIGSTDSSIGGSAEPAVQAPPVSGTPTAEPFVEASDSTDDLPF